VKRRGEPDREDESRRRIVRRVSLYAYALVVATVVVSLVGAAIVAAILHLAGMPFLKTWIIIAVLVIVIPIVGLTVRERWRKP
jgi:predicted PurR-regulated permease PerM